MVRPLKSLQLGKNGLTEAFVSQVKHFFESERMIKIVILKSACRDKVDAKRIADELVNALGDKFDYKLVGYVLTIIKFRKSVRG